MKPSTPPSASVGAVVLLLACCASSAAQGGRDLLDRAVVEFERGQFAASVATFDELVRVAPSRAPHLWQRGIALYYANRYADCRRQFELHRTVNPDDVENAAWHFLCVARERNVEAARSALLPVGPDARRPMQHVYKMLQRAATPDEVMAAAGSDSVGQFYGHLYVGLYYEALGRKDLAQQHIAAAAADRFAAGGYMHMVARVHLNNR